MIVLTPLKKYQYPVIAECITPDIFQGKNKEEISNLSVWEGNKERKLCELFKIEINSAKSPDITINGDVIKVKRIGWGMTQGEIVVNGNVGMHLGKKMVWRKNRCKWKHRRLDRFTNERRPNRDQRRCR